MKPYVPLRLYILAALALGMAVTPGTFTAWGGPAPVDGKDHKATATETTTEETEDFKNWIELGIGGVITNGDRAQFEQEHRLPGDQVYGGIQDLHYEHSLGSDVQLAVDGHALWDFNDYSARFDISKAKLGYLRFGYDGFRSWYDGHGGFFPLGNVWFDPYFDEMHVDRGEAWVELGLRLPDWPEITVRYEHLFRNGEKDSLMWGDTDLTAVPPPTNPTRKIVPAWRDIDETRDVLSAEIAKTFGNTDLNIGMRWERSKVDNRLELERNPRQNAVITFPGGTPTVTGKHRFITQHENIDNDIYNAHVISETRFSDNLWFTGAYGFSTVDSDIAGTRVIGTHYNASFGEPILTLQANDHGVLNLAGISQVDEHVFNSNLFWVPLTDLNVITAFRYTHEEQDSDSTFLDTNTAANTAPFTVANPRNGFHIITPLPRSADTFERNNVFNERLELRYTHIENWLFYLEGEWEEEFGDVHEHEVGGAIVRGVATASDEGRLNKDTYLLGQKYTAGATWYPSLWMNLAAQYYFKATSYDADFHSELRTPTDVPAPLGAERNQRLIGQDWSTNDVNVRLTLRPKVPAALGTISLVSRYDFMISSAEGKWAVSPTRPPPVVIPPPPAIPTNTIFNEEHTGTITKHMITETLNWNPTARLYFDATASVVLDQTKTPADGRVLIPNTTATLVPSRNDYWTVGGGAGFLIDNKTDIRADYLYYRANDYFNNARVAMPYGAGQTEHSVSATISRQITKNVRVLARYAYFTFEDQTSGNHNNYEAHSIYSGLQYRF